MPVVDSHLQVNKRLASPYIKPARDYLALAQQERGEERQALLLMAAGRLIHDGQWQQGQLILSQIKATSVELSDKKHLLLAKIELIRQQPRKAINHLSMIQELDHVSLYYQVQYHEMLADAYGDLGNTSESVSERIKLDPLLPDEASKANNHRALWLTLTTMPEVELNTLALEAPEHSLLKGWMQLATVSRHDFDEPTQMLSAIGQWRDEYPNHPANSILSTTNQEFLFAQPREMALLLPLTGPFSGPGHAIKDGFMAAYKASSDGAYVRVRVYDTHEKNAAQVYQEALLKGAHYVVGPLLKDNVAMVASLHHPVPTVLLNDLNTAKTPNAYQFGLSPNDEAKQVAVRARNHGYTRALVIAPRGSWGEDVVSSFTTQWQDSGGRVQDVLYYGSQENLTPLIRDFLRVSASEAREKQLKKALGRRIESTPSRRQDFDVIFLLAYPSKARQIMPLLKYYYAGDVPVYATSSVYSGTPNSLKDRDINDLIFGDMPWAFNHPMPQKHWPEQYNSYTRLYALGQDSYALSSQLNQLLLFPSMGVSDKSGVLYLNPNNRIARLLVWGQFRRGLPERLSG